MLFGIAAYGLWGVFPLYLHLLDDIRPMEVVANRIAWSLIVVAAILFVTRRLGRIGAIMRDRRLLRLLAPAAVLIAVNWAVYIYAISVDRVIEGALGYFITPLVSVAFGMAVFGERLRRAQAVALVLGTLAVVVLTVYYGGFPWISVTLGLSFGTYGLLKKLADVPTAEALAVETLLLFLPAVALMAGLAWTGEGALFSDGAGTTLLLVGAGPVTAVPLLLFGASVTRVPLTTIGLMQYLTPVLQFLIGWLVLGEAMPATRWIGFALVWSALAVLTWDALRAVRREGAAGERVLAEEIVEPA
ncbi:EamA family transporter RarD [Capillimicrobium parvum]|uniref:Protein RarD n=1 Tax=Capillimicrobium parvum TaxID=2884022 RepID=A0A9E6XZ47_9ACTN|nr:EamA family transporter RarD [Capillimicrobium parvum]UGS36970.1 Protein RarD [Capillimicrobium parvum]